MKMKNEKNQMVDLSLDEQSTINGGTFAKDAGYAIGYSIDFNLKVLEFAIDPFGLFS